MSNTAKVSFYDSQSEAYQQAFRVFLEHTDQKANAHRWLDGLVQSLPARRVFLDAGAGPGQVTAWFVNQFERTIAIEPAPYLNAELRQNCPTAEVLATPILAAQPGARADLILCSHVLYYIETAAWRANVDRMASWLAPGGVLVIVLQNPETDCMRMLQAFLGRRFDLTALAEEFQKEHGPRYRVDRQLKAA